MHQLRNEMRSEVSRLRDEKNRELIALEARFDRMSRERFEEKLWWLQVAAFGGVVAAVVASILLSQPP